MAADSMAADSWQESMAAVSMAAVRWRYCSLASASFTVALSCVDCCIQAVELLTTLFKDVYDIPVVEATTSELCQSVSNQCTLSLHTRLTFRSRKQISDIDLVASTSGQWWGVNSAAEGAACRVLQDAAGVMATRYAPTALNAPSSTPVESGLRRASGTRSVFTLSPQIPSSRHSQPTDSISRALSAHRFEL